MTTNFGSHNKSGWKGLQKVLGDLNKAIPHYSQQVTCYFVPILLKRFNGIKIFSKSFNWVSHPKLWFSQLIKIMGKPHNRHSNAAAWYSNKQDSASCDHWQEVCKPDFSEHEKQVWGTAASRWMHGFKQCSICPRSVKPCSVPLKDGLFPLLKLPSASFTIM